MRVVDRSSKLGLMALVLVTGLLSTAQPAAGQQPFIGEIRWVAFNFAPRGWADCDGQLLPIAQHTALFSLLGTVYGGDGRTTFALPDMRGRVAVHEGTGPGLSPRSLGEKAGVEAHVLTIAEIPSHGHTIESHTHDIPALSVDVKASSASGTDVDPAGRVLAAADAGGGRGRGRSGGAGPTTTQIYNAGPADVSLAAGSAMTVAGTTGGGSGTTTPNGGGGAHENMQPFLGLRCVIALQGIFPPRN